MSLLEPQVKKTLIVVDDDDAVLSFLEVALNRIGLYEVIAKSSALQALEIAAIRKIDVIISDINMPRMDGIEFLRELRNRNYDGRFIVISGRPSRSLIAECFRHGMDTYLGKPFGSEQLKSTIARVLSPVFDPLVEREAFAFRAPTPHGEISQYSAVPGAVESILHDLGNEFSSIGARISTMEFVADQPEKVRDQCCRLRKSMQYCQLHSAIIKSLVESNDISITPTEANVIVSQAAELYRELLPDNLTFTIDISEGNQRITTNIEVAVFILIELIRNAAKAIGPHSGAIAVQIRACEGWVIIEVRDNGPGISTKNKFPFQRPPVGARNGWGLYLCGRCADSIRAKLGIKSSDASGTVFELALPLSE